MKEGYKKYLQQNSLKVKTRILDGSIVLIKRVDQLEHDEIGIFNINGNSMCKRFTKVDGKITLVPDNTANEYKTIEIRQDMVCSIQGKVISVM